MKKNHGNEINLVNTWWMLNLCALTSSYSWNVTSLQLKSTNYVKNLSYFLKTWITFGSEKNLLKISKLYEFFLVVFLRAEKSAADSEIRFEAIESKTVGRGLRRIRLHEPIRSTNQNHNVFSESKYFLRSVFGSKIRF